MVINRIIKWYEDRKAGIIKERKEHRIFLSHLATKKKYNINDILEIHHPHYCDYSALKKIEIKSNVISLLENCNLTLVCPICSGDIRSYAQWHGDTACTEFYYCSNCDFSKGHLCYNSEVR